MKDFQYAIIGGGLVGATTAIMLSQFGLPICLIEKDKISSSLHDRPAIQTPTLALSYATRLFFEHLDLWHDIEPFTQPIHVVHVNSQGHLGSTHLWQQPGKYPELGYVVNVFGLKKVLFDKIQQLSNITLFTESTLEKFHFRQPKWICQLKGSQSITASLLISAEGHSGLVAKQLAIPYLKTHYPHRTMMANIKLSESLRGIAVERFLKNGVIAALPWKDNCATMILSQPKNNIDMLKTGSDSEVILACQNALGESFGLIETIGKKIFLDLTMCLSQQHFYKQLLLLGNSAHSIHPIAAQGFNLSVRDIARLEQSINDFGREPVSWGLRLDDLNVYVRTCQADQQKIISATDQLARSVEKIPSALKTIGLWGLEYLMPLKNHLTRQAMGL